MNKRWGKEILSLFYGGLYLKSIKVSRKTSHLIHYVFGDHPKCFDQDHIILWLKQRVHLLEDILQGQSKYYLNIILKQLSQEDYGSPLAGLTGFMLFNYSAILCVHIR